MWQKEQAVIRRCAECAASDQSLFFCPSISWVFPDDVTISCSFTSLSYVCFPPPPTTGGGHSLSCDKSLRCLAPHPRHNPRTSYNYGLAFRLLEALFIAWAQKPMDHLGLVHFSLLWRELRWEFLHAILGCSGICLCPDIYRQIFPYMLEIFIFY